MENAGRAVADSVAARHPPGPHIAVVAGPGNNGGDGFVAARLLAERGYRVRVLLVGDAARLKGDAALAAQRWSGPIEAASRPQLTPADVVIDALFGAGLDRPVEGTARAMIEAMNASAACIMPSICRAGSTAPPGDDGPGGQSGGNGDVLPPQARPCAAARAPSLRNRSRRRHRHPSERARSHQAANMGQRARALGEGFSAAAGRGPQICPRPCRRGLRRARLDRRRAARRARRAAGGSWPRHDREPARSAAGQRGRKPRGDGAAGRWRARACGIPARRPPQRRGAGTGRRGRAQRCANWCSPRSPASVRRARCRCAHELCRRAAGAHRRHVETVRDDASHAARRRVQSTIQGDDGPSSFKA